MDGNIIHDPRQVDLEDCIRGPTAPFHGPTVPLSRELHASKYRDPDETFEQAMERIASRLADSASHYDHLLDILLDMRFLPAGRVQNAIGAKRDVTALNCFVSGTIADAFTGPGSIMERASEAAETMRMGGGIGYDFSGLRPRGDIIRKLNSRSSGPVAFMDIYNAVCGTVSSAGHRRGAQMGVLRVDHPDIEQFIEAKTQPGVLTRFNVSVAVTDAFMEAMLLGKPFELKFGGQVYKTVDAQELWEKIMRTTWDWAEPGVLFIDRINEMNNLYYCENIAATNPCFTADTKVRTVGGALSFGELVASGVKSIPVLTQLEDGKLAFREMTNPRKTQRAQKLVKVTLRGSGRSAGQLTTLRCTPNHKFFLCDGSIVEAQNLVVGASVHSFYRYKANSAGYIKVACSAEDIMEHHLSAEFRYGRRPTYPHEHVHHINGTKDDNAFENVELIEGTHHNAMNMREKNAAGLMLHGTYTGNPGEANGRYREDISDGAIADLRVLGLSYAAIASRLGCSKYTVMKRSGWQRPNHTVESVELLTEVEDVYCGTVASTGRFFVALGDGNEGVLVSNCGEQPLPPYGCCLLGSFNLVKYLRRDGDGYRFSLTKLEEDIPAVVRAMDNVVDATSYPLPQQEKEQKSKRRMGLGVTGLANCAEALRFPYGSRRFLDFERSILRRLRDGCYHASALLAQAKGSFPKFDRERYLAGKFAKTLMPEVREMIGHMGLRNSHLLSIAPTGTISLCADNVSSGLEPVFAYSFERTVQEFDGPRVETVYDYGFRKLGVRGRRAADVAADWHIDVLCVAAQHVDSAVSKTCNVSPNMPWDEFKNLYRAAWEGGAKGVTTFNPGGKRAGILVANEDAEEDTKDAAPSCSIDPETGRRSCE